MSPYEEMNLSHLQELWDDSKTEESERVLILENIIARAEVASSPKCLNCKKAVCYLPHTHGIGQGHVYSWDGRIEFTQLSGICEFCFDLLMADPEEEE